MWSVGGWVKNRAVERRACDWEPKVSKRYPDQVWVSALQYLPANEQVPRLGQRVGLELYE